MAAAIYKMHFVRVREAWYQISPEEQDSLIRKADAARAQVGGKTVVRCDSSWSSEQWSTFGIEFFPSIEAVQKYAALLTDINWFRYIEAKTVLGIEASDYVALAP